MNGETQHFESKFILTQFWLCTPLISQDLIKDRIMSHINYTLA